RKTGDMHVRVTDQTDLVNTPERVVSCTPKEERVRIIIFESKAAIRSGHSRRGAQAGGGIVVGKGVKDVRASNPGALGHRPFRARRLSEKGGKRAEKTNDRKSVEQSCREGVAGGFQQVR